MNVTVNRNGGIRLGVQRGFILPLDAIQWILSRIEGKTVETPKNRSMLEQEVAA